MTFTWTDLFAGAGGSSTGITHVPGQSIRIAANHWQLVTEIHNANHPDADHAVVDLHQERPSFFPKTDGLWASPECTKWSQANGSEQPAIEEGLWEDPLSDEAKNRSRLLMFDVLKFVEHHRYRLVVVENVVDIATQAKYRTAWQVWRQELRALGYEFAVVSLNSMHAQVFGAPAPQSRDRLYVLAWPEGEKAPDVDRITRPKALCMACDQVVEARQAWKRGKAVGRYKQAYLYACPLCGGIVEPAWLPAAAAIDWSLTGERIADRSQPLAEKTLARIAAGIARYWGPLSLEAAGNTYDAAASSHPQHGEPNAYYRSWPVGEAMRALHTTNSKALAVPVEGRDGKSALSVDEPSRTQTTRNETGLAQMPFISEMYGTSTGRPVTEPAGTFTAGGNHHALVMSYYSRDDAMKRAHDPIATITTEPRHALLEAFVMTNQHANRPYSTGEPMPTATTATGGGQALVTRHNGSKGDQSHLTTPADEWMRTLTTTAQQSIMRRPGDVTAADIAAAREMLPEVRFRMFEPHEVAAGMAFPSDYVWQPSGMKPVSKRDKVKAAGNAVTPPSSRDIVGIAIESVLA